MKILHILAIFILLISCDGSSIEPPNISVDVAQLAPEAAAAIRSQQDTVASTPENAMSWRNLGMLYQAHGLHEAAIQAYRYVGQISKDPQSLYLEAIANARLGNYDEALRLAARIRNYPPAEWRQGQWLMDLDRLDEAAAKFQAVIQGNPTIVAAIVGLSRVHIAQNNPDDAILLLEDIRSRGGNHPYVLFLLGTANQLAGNQSLASTLLTGSMPGPPKWKDPWRDQMTSVQRGFAATLSRANAKIAQGDLQGAKAILIGISKSHPRNTAVQNNLATVYLQLKDLKKANEILVKSIRITPDYAPTQLTMAMVLQRQGEPERAILYAKTAVELQPAMSAAYALLGRLYLQLSDLQSALGYLSESLSIGNNDPMNREIYAMVLLDLGQSKEAVKQFEMVLQIFPARTISTAGLALATASLGNKDAAMKILQQALKRNPNDINLQRAVNTVQKIVSDQ